jgi:hypothetical protein
MDDFNDYEEESDGLFPGESVSWDDEIDAHDDLADFVLPDEDDDSISEEELE